MTDVIAQGLVATANNSATFAKIRATLLSLAARAEAGNPVDSPPWTYPAPWSASTAYASGAVVVTTAGNVYIAMTAGTSGTTQPSQTYPVGVPADGSVYWAYVGGISITASDPMAPTTATGGQSALYGNGYINTYYPLSSPNVALIDAAGMTNSFGAAQPCGWSNGASGTTAAGGAFAFETEAASFAISYPYTTAKFRVMIDGRWNTIGPEAMLSTQTGGNNFNYTLFTFPGGAKTRRIVIDCSNISGSQALVYTIQTKGNDMIRPAKIGASMAVIADSWGQGAGYDFVIGNRWPQQLARLLGFDQVYNYSIGGTGFVNIGPGPNNTFGARVPLLTSALSANGQQSPALWVFGGSINDNSSTAASIRAGVTAAMQNVRSVSNAPIVIFGVQPTPGDATATFAFSTSSGSTTVTVTAKTSGTIAVGDKITSGGIFAAGTTVTGLGTYSTGTGTGTISVSSAPGGAYSGQTGYANAGVAALANEAAQLAAVTAFNDPLVFYVPVYGDPIGPWIAGLWNNQGNSFFSNSGALIGNDQTHSYDYGYNYWAKRMSNRIKQLIYAKFS